MKLNWFHEDGVGWWAWERPFLVAYDDGEGLWAPNKAGWYGYDLSRKGIQATGPFATDGEAKAAMEARV